MSWCMSMSGSLAYIAYIRSFAKLFEVARVQEKHIALLHFFDFQRRNFLFSEAVFGNASEL